MSIVTQNGGRVRVRSAMRTTVFLCIVAVLTGCNADIPSAPPVVARPLWRVYVTPAWSAYDRAVIESELPKLWPWGTFIATDDETVADMGLDRNTLGDCRNYAGTNAYQEPWRLVTINPACVFTDDDLRSFVAHQLGHALGLRDVTEDAGPSVMQYRPHELGLPTFPDHTGLCVPTDLDVDALRSVGLSR